MIEGARRRVTTALARETDAAALIAFRVILGALVTVSAIRFLAYGWVDELFVKPTFFFKYWGFGWVPALAGPQMHAVFAAMSVLGVCFAAGALYRVVAPTLFALFTYVQLVDATNWLNHYYLVSLLLLLASVMPLGRAGSVDALVSPRARLTRFPSWCTYLLRFQVGVVYVFAGLAKLNSDWLLHAQPLNIWLEARTGLPILGGLFGHRATAYVFSWAGFLFDTFVVAFLLARRTRPWAYAVVVVFHAMTWLLFPIGMFPFIMTAAALVFFDPDWPRALARRVGLLRDVAGGAARAEAPATRPRRMSLVLGGVYCALQVLVPLRAHAYGGNVLWHEQGMRFAWKVMAREKNGSITYVVESKSAGKTWYASPRRYLTDRQERELSAQPDLVCALARHVADDYRARGYADVRVRVEALVSLNGRPAAPIIDSDVDLASVDVGLARAAFILPAPEGPPIHLKSAWNVRPSSSRSGS